MSDAEKGRYWWWNCSDILDLFTMVTKVGADNLRLEFRPDREKSLVLVDRRVDVEEGGDAECGEFNVSHTCPPSCP